MSDYADADFERDCIDAQTAAITYGTEETVFGLERIIADRNRWKAHALGDIDDPRINTDIEIVEGQLKSSQHPQHGKDALHRLVDDISRLDGYRHSWIGELAHRQHVEAERDALKAEVERLRAGKDAKNVDAIFDLMDENAEWESRAGAAEGTLEVIRMQLTATPWQATPVEANVYHDDNRWCIHLWKDGVSHDIFVPLSAIPNPLTSEVERLNHYDALVNSGELASRLAAAEKVCEAARPYVESDRGVVQPSYPLLDEAFAEWEAVNR